MMGMLLVDDMTYTKEYLIRNEGDNGKKEPYELQYFTRQRATPGNVPLALAAIRGTFHVYNNII